MRFKYACDTTAEVNDYIAGEELALFVWSDPLQTTVNRTLYVRIHYANRCVDIGEISPTLLTTMRPRGTCGISRGICSDSNHDAPVLGCLVPLCPTGSPRVLQCTFLQLHPGGLLASVRCPAAAAHRTSLVLVFKPTQAESNNKLSRPAGNISLGCLVQKRAAPPTRGSIDSSEPCFVAP